MTPKELLKHCAEQINMDYPALNCIVLKHPRGAGRFPFSGKGVELLNEMNGCRVYSVDIEVVLAFVAKGIKEARKAASEEWERTHGAAT